MTVAHRETPPEVPKAEPEYAAQRFVLHGVGWDEYEALYYALLDRHPGLHLTYLEGMLEFMSPSSPRHEWIKSSFGRLVGTYAVEKNIPLNAYGQTTFRKKAQERGAEPDECYAIGRRIEDGSEEIPDIVFEVDLTSGSIDKLAVYRGLGVPEVWFWKQGRIHVRRLVDGRYEERGRSEFLPDLDLEELARWLEHPDQTAAVRAFRDSLRASG